MNERPRPVLGPDHRPGPRPPGTWQAVTSLGVASVALLLSWVPGINAVGALAALMLVATWQLVATVPRAFDGDAGYESSTDADGRAGGPIAEDVDVTRCGPTVGDDSLRVSVTVRNSRIASSDDVVLVHALDDEGRLVGEVMGSIRAVDPREEKLEIFSVAATGPAAECVVAKVVRL